VGVKRSPSALGRWKRNKGANFERWVSNVFKAVYETAKRGLGQARSAGEVPDSDIPTWWPECKAHKLTNPRAALAQAIEASAGSGRVPIAVCKDDHKPPIVTLRLEDFVRLLARAEGKPLPAEWSLPAA
jgi:hypothetical protein